MIRRALVTCGFCISTLYGQATVASDVPAPSASPTIKGDARSRAFASDAIEAAGKLRARGDLAAARAYLQRAAEMQESASAATIDRLGILIDLDGLLTGRDHTAELESVRSKILADWTDALGPDELVIANSCETLASVLAEEGKSEDADKLWDQAIAVLRPNLGPNHPAVEWALTQKLRLERNSSPASPLLERATQTKAELDLAHAARGTSSVLPLGTKVERVGKSVIRPKVISQKDPEYSEEGRKKRVQGTVLLAIVVGVNGVPDRVQVLQPLGMGLDEKAETAVRSWLFEPGKKDGVAVPVKAAIEVNFRLR